MRTFGEGIVYLGGRRIPFDVTNGEIEINTLEENYTHIDGVCKSMCKKETSIGYLPEIKRVIYNSPYTIVIWADGTKTIVKKQPGEYYDGEKGLAMCIAKKALGNTSKYYETFKKHDRDKTVIYCGTCKYANLSDSELPCKGCFSFEHYEREDRR